MNRVRVCAMCASFVLAACGGDAAPLAASGVIILAPMPGHEMAVAYLSLENRGTVPVTLARVTSPQFSSVEMHATIIDDGIAVMTSLDSITIAGQSNIDFAVGGRHLMLLAPHESLVPGDAVTLQFHYDQAGLLHLTAPLQSRMARNEGN
ncbi:MAG: copper chaperone PCu(A)C [Woeseia sp.]